MKAVQGVSLVSFALTLVACASTRFEHDVSRCTAACEVRHEQCLDRDAVVTVEREQYCRDQRQTCLTFCPVGEDAPPRY